MQPQQPYQSQPVLNPLPQQPVTQSTVPVQQQVVPQQPLTQPNPYQTATQAPIPPLPQQRHKMPAWLIVVLSVVAIIIVIIVILVVAGVNAIKAPVKVSNEFMDDVQADKVAAAYSLTSSEFQAKTDEDTLRSFLDSKAAYLQGTRHETGASLMARSGTNQTVAIITYSIDARSGEVYARVVLVQESGAWHVITFEPSSTPLSSNSTE